SESCSITLSLPEDADFCFEDLIAITDMEGLTDDCGENYDFKLEVQYIGCGGISTGYIFGVSTCYSVLTCACGFGDDVLCDDYVILPADFNDDCYSYYIDIATANALTNFEEYWEEQKDIFRK